MPQFFFNVRRGSNIHADTVGRELEDLHAAYKWAVQDTRSLIKEDALEGDLRLYSIEICDADGRVLSVLPVTGS
ncbi:MAG: hypothetical protein EON57_00900 [Alphaproteobacteria bacterium]|nr:MAG: hypothetical protein EON57_00900 [Alphaproteobacteria bacterium]